MHIAYLNLASNKDLKNPGANLNLSNLPHPVFNELKVETLSIVQRAPFDATNKFKNFDFYFIKDEFGSKLLWWQEPVSALEKLSEIKPDLIQVRGLNLPLQFRWLRREVGNKIKIIGEHTGETIWANRNLWLQQFGFRVVDGFIFEKMENAESWTKASVILERQSISEISLTSKKIEATKILLSDFYNKLLNTKI